MRKLIVVALVLVLAAAGVYVVAGRATAPEIRIASPDKFVGASTPLEVTVDAPRGELASLTVAFEQGGKETTLYSMAAPPSGVRVAHEGADRIRVSGDLGRASVPGLASGAARIVVKASRATLFGLNHVYVTANRDVRVRLEMPRVSVLSIHHYVNLGGSEMVVYRASPEDVTSGVKVGDLEYPGYSAKGAAAEGVAITDPAVHVAFFALRYDQDVNTPMTLFARDEAGNAAQAEFDHKTFPKPFKHSTIPLEDKFLDRVVPAILAGTTEIKPGGATIDQFLAINGELRRRNNATIAAFAKQTAPDMLWGGVVFHPFANTKVEAAFADFRTYTYQGREVDRQVHLGFDLASFANTTVVAANRGKVLFAAELGIYGHAVIIDHGMGVQSLYGHLSAIDVRPGAMVEKDQPLGKSGKTGLAVGDHLHFTMLVNGQMVNPIEWWDPHWIADRILRKLHDAK